MSKTEKTKKATQAAFDGRAFARRTSHSPGVYRMLDARGKALYVGKARNLKKRVGSYFGRDVPNTRIAQMLSLTCAIEVQVTRTEGEALLLENQLIKALKPRYNVLLRDDKSYPYIYLSGNEAYPRLAFHRGARKLPGEFFGPYPSAGAVRKSLKLLQKLFLLRQCEDSYFRNRSRPCLQHQIKRCTAPCVGAVSTQAYDEQVRHTRMFLQGRSHSVIEEMIAAMDKASNELAFERAAELRDQIRLLKKIQQEQHVEGQGGDIDIVAVAIAKATACVEVIFVRAGRDVGNRAFFPKLPPEADESVVISGFLAQFYSARMPPPQIIVSAQPEDQDLLELAFSERAERKVRITRRPRGQRAQWQKLAQSNAQHALTSQLASAASLRQRFESLAQLLDLEAPPERIECMDISHTMGEAAVGSCVVMGPEGPLKSDYRRYNIRNVKPGDDYAALAEVLQRRFRRAGEDEGGIIPDIMFIDGGRGQLNSAIEAVADLQLPGMLLAGISKGPERRPGEELVHLPDSKRALRPGPNSPALHLIQSVRDEAHRFAITGHRTRRGKQRVTSVLEEIPGVGNKRRQQLLKHFGGLQGLQAAGAEEIAAVAGFSMALAERIYRALNET